MATGGIQFRFEGFELDTWRLELRGGDRRIEVQPKVLQLLRYLLENADRTVTKGELLEALWPDSVVGEGSLTSAIRLARRALGEQQRDARVILTVHGLGYRIGLPVEVVPVRATGREFVGRAGEIEALERALQLAIDGNGQIVGIVGAAGVGKSRLCLEFLERCRMRGLLVLEAHCRPYGRDVPLLPILELLRASLGITAGDSDARAREKITRRLLLLDEEFRPSLPLVFDFLGVSESQARPALPDPGVRQREISDFLQRLVAARSVREPAVLLVDDLHWIDPGSDLLLADLARAVRVTRTLLLVNFRPEYRADWVSAPHFQELALAPLGFEDVRDLLAAVLGRDPSFAGLAELIYDRTRGNPFFIEEVVRSLLEAHRLVGSKGAYRLVVPLDELAVPSTPESSLAARIDRLPDLERELLQTAAAIGRRFAQEFVRCVAQLPEADLTAALERLRESEFLRQEAVYPDVEYAFKHPLTREAAEHSLPVDRRRQVHAAIARVLEVQHADKLDEQASVLAHHWEQAGDALRAAEWHQRAAEWVAGRAPYEALRHWRRVRSLAAGQRSSSSAARLILTACGETLRLAWQTVPPSDELASAFEEGRRLAERTGDLRSLALLVHGYAVVRGHAGDVRTWHALALEAASLAEHAQDVSVFLLAQQDVAHTHFLLGRPSEALSLVDWSLELAARELNLLEDPRGALALGVLRWLRGFVLIFLGRLDDAEREIARLLSLARARELHMVLFRGLAASALLASSRGDPEQTLARAREARKLADRLGPLQLAEAEHLLGMAQAHNEIHSEAVQNLEHSLAVSRERETYLPMESQVLADLAEAYLGCDRDRRARAAAENAIQLARHRGTRLFECKAQLALARVLMKLEGAGGAEPIRAALACAQRLARETGTPPFDARFHEESARLAQLMGDVSAREIELRKARHLFAEMGATGHAERLGAQLGI